MMGATRHVLDADDYPMLSQFVAGYLHEDFVVEHRTPARARDAFLRDASTKERAALAAELERFRVEAEALPWADVRAAFAALGGAWRPASRAALNALLGPPSRSIALPPRSGRRRS